MTELVQEMVDAALRVRRNHFDALEAMGVSAPAIGQIGERQWSIGATRIETDGMGRYQPVEHGESALLIAVCAPPDCGFEPAIVDIVAVRSSEPSRWFWRMGNGVVLGEDMIVNDIGEAVPVVADPIRWLANAAKAICILDWSDRSPVWPMLRHGPPLKFNDDALRQKVANALVKSAPMPNMEIAA